MMEMQDNLEASGRWLFRWRSYLPAVLLIPLAIAAAEFRWPLGRHDVQEVWESICLSTTAVGLALRVLVAGHAPCGTSGRNTRRQHADSLNTTGMYSLCRHPLYVGNFLVALGWTMFLLNGWLVAVYVMAFWLYYERIAMAEEGFLREKFGSSFREWAAATNAFLPQWKKWRRPMLPFCWRTALRREYQTIAGAIVAFVSLELLEHWLVERRVVLEPFWEILIAAALGGFILVRLLVKRTRLLMRPGR